MSELPAKPNNSQNDKGDRIEKEGHQSSFWEIKPRWEAKEAATRTDESELSERNNYSLSLCCLSLFFSITQQTQGSQEGHNEHWVLYKRQILLYRAETGQMMRRRVKANTMHKVLDQPVERNVSLPRGRLHLSTVLYTHTHTHPHTLPHRPWLLILYTLPSLACH